MRVVDLSFFFNDTATTEIYTLSLHDALPISATSASSDRPATTAGLARGGCTISGTASSRRRRSSSISNRSEEHTSELQSRQYLVCRLLLEKKNYYRNSCRINEHHCTGSDPY